MNGKQFRKRNAILACLCQSKSHPSAEELYAILRQEQSDISLASVYRNLALFKEQGIAVSLGSVNGIERFDGCTEPHAHFTCTTCGSVQDVPEYELQLPQSVGIACRIDSVQLMFSGLCESCLNSQI